MVFLILEVEESKGDDPFIDLLGTLPKASGKLPVEDDEERRRSKKRRHRDREVD